MEVAPLLENTDANLKTVLSDTNKVDLKNFHVDLSHSISPLDKQREFTKDDLGNFTTA